MSASAEAFCCYWKESKQISPDENFTIASAKYCHFCKSAFSAGNLCHQRSCSLLQLQGRAKGGFPESGKQGMLCCWCCRLPGTEQRTDCLETRSYTRYLDVGRGRDLDISSFSLNNLRSAGQVHSSSLPEKERSLDSRWWGGWLSWQFLGC